MGRVQDAVTAALAAEISSRTGWDELPVLFTVYYSGGAGHLRRVPIPDATWKTAPTVVILDLIADMGDEHARLLRETVAPGLHGAAFFTEAWMATAPAGTAEGDDLLARARAVRGRVSQLADKVETRTMWAVDRAGITYTALQPRGGRVQSAVSYPRAGKGSFAGDIPRALDRLVTAFLGVDLPERQAAKW